MSMTESEKVKKWFDAELSMRPEESLDSVECEEIKDICLNAIEEIQQYRAIGTVSEFRELKEKATAKKPDLDKDDDGEDCLVCPNCGSFIVYGIDCLETEYQDAYCSNCGQRLLWFDWSEGKE